MNNTNIHLRPLDVTLKSDSTNQSQPEEECRKALRAGPLHCDEVIFINSSLIITDYLIKDRLTELEGKLNPSLLTSLFQKYKWK